MGTRFRELECVRIVKLESSSERYDGWRINQRPPRVGDVGAIVDVLHAPGLPDRYVVESTDSENGAAIWLGDFAEVELEPMA